MIVATKRASQMSLNSARILIYGFGPYRHFQRNVTETVVRGFPRIRRLKRIVFPVKFQKIQFIKAVTDHQPDVILGLGQCSRGSLLRIEAAAYNRRRRTKNERPRPIVRGGALKLPTNLPLDLGRQARASNNPGDYVCNYSMYVIMEFLRRRRRQACLGFVHIPHKYDPKKVTRLLAKALGQIAVATKSRV